MWTDYRDDIFEGYGEDTYRASEAWDDQFPLSVEELAAQLIEAIEQSNGLEFVSPDRRAKLAHLLIDPSVPYVE